MKVYKLWIGNPMTSNKAKGNGFVLTPDTVTEETVMAAWSYAIRYSAKGLDVPDYEAALKLFQQRHPSWQYFPTDVVNVWYKAEKADSDTPE
jgi:hypothetical protein